MPFARGNQLVWFSDFLEEGVFDTMRRLSHLEVQVLASSELHGCRVGACRGFVSRAVLLDKVS